MAPKNTKVVELLTLMVKKKCPMVAITDNSGALLTTFSFSCLRVRHLSSSNATQRNATQRNATQRNATQRNATQQ
jgi:DNA-binding MurR/RpiR family transcriptional regulator